ncbi:MAG TPA: acyl-CoA dehydrogenase family protein [Dehalococcoidia bacterium]|nr:acyl-CoA dehydrogenase family protein [Dehalococcoidia bacterium]
MQVAEVPGLSDEINDIRRRTAAIVDGAIIPAEPRLREPGPERSSLYRELQQRVKDEGLWAPHLPTEYGGMGIGFLAHAYMNEVLAWSPYSGGIFGVVAPNSGNETVLIKYGSEEQKQRWLWPLIRGEIESCFSMTEPDQPGSDPYAIQTRAVRDGDDWVINGHKWFTSNARRAAFAIVVCRTEDGEDGAGARERMTQIIVPTDTPGFNIVRSVPVWGHEGGDHCEIIYDNVRVPLTNQLGRRGSGHQAAQDRLGAGRVFHCMSCVGQMWRAFDLMARRAITRQVHGGMLETKQFIQGFLADSYIDIQAARLMTIHTAQKIDAGLDVRTDISAIKVFVPACLERVVDRAIQVYGAMGVSSDTPLEGMYRGARTLRIADGPDEVHRIVIARNVLRRYHEGMSWDFGA